MKEKYDPFVIIPLYAVFYLYAVTNIPEVIYPPQGTDPYIFELLAGVIKSKGLMLKDFPSYFFTPFYAYFVYLIRAVSPTVTLHFKLLIAVQIVIFIFSIFYFKKLIGQLFSVPVARIGFYLYALYPPILFFSVLPVKTIVEISLFTFTLYNFIRYLDDHKRIPLILSGLFMGILIHFRGAVVCLLPILLIVLYTRHNIASVLLFLISATICIVPFTARNLHIAHEQVLLSSVGGIHFYIGNNPHATGIYNTVQGIEPSTFGHYYDARRIAMHETKTYLTDQQVSSYWKKKGLDFIKTKPLSALLLYVKKSLLLINYVEIANNYNFKLFTREYTPFKFLRIPYNFTALFIAGILGFIYGKFRYRIFFILCTASLALTTLTIFITNRYRMPLAIFLLIGTCGLIDGLRKHEFRVSSEVVIVGIILFSLSFFPAFKHPRSFLTSSYIKFEKSKDSALKRKELGAEQFEKDYYSGKLKYVSGFTNQHLFR
ncbi:MAG: hypothetical protein H7A34_02145 [bacterium]|nr:hypothetical protein [bacterium]